MRGPHVEMNVVSEKQTSEQQLLLPSHIRLEPPRTSAGGNDFLSFFFATFVVYLLFRDIKGLLHMDHHYHSTSATDGHLQTEWDLPAHLTIDHCTHWPESEDSPDHWPSSTQTMELPLSANKLFLLSRGPLAVGDLHIVQSADTGDNIKVVTTVDYDIPRHLDHLEFCLLKGPNGAMGAGIFTYRRDEHPRRRRHRLAFHVTVEIPASKDESTVTIKDFETDMDFFTQHVHELDGGFDSNRSSIQALTASQATLDTHHSPIKGSFVVTKSLTLSTANSAIEANVTLKNSPDSDESTSLKMTTSNGLHVQTSISPIHIKLHPTYEGTFGLSTSWAKAQVIYDREVEDPAGKERERRVEFMHPTRGIVEWEEGGRDRGVVEISTSLSPATLYL
ncbi:hypothetical protein C8J56DRAFT_979583 [Mycena floridula]|nr:hypothetical protein C8J56DRAFT_979583 [Mycena floridula]